MYLTLLLLDKLKSSAPSRIVTLSSKGHEYYSLDFADLQTSRRWAPVKAYGRSKTANLLFSVYLGKLLQGL
jgi:retinol dehydrogenase-12